MVVIQIVNDAPIPNPEFVSIAALQFPKVVVRSVRVRRNLSDLGHDPPLPIHRELGKGLIERLRGNHAIHGLIVTRRNNYTPLNAPASQDCEAVAGDCNSDRMQRLLDLVGQVSSSRSTILITGETGTGKELIAKAIHANSPRSERLFIPVNSGSLPADLLESTLFGHVKGAFTSAIQTKKGYFEVADRGTIFFDEIGTIAPDMQAKLLRVIQEKEFIPLGATEPVRVDVRILAATNDDLKKRVDEGTFREDLYYRLNVINIVLPPLRERKEDIPALVKHFFTKYCRENEKYLDAQGNSVLSFQPEVLQIPMEHNWPGNVRELENAVERAVVLATDPSVPLDLDVLPDHLLQASGIRLRRAEGGALPADASLFEIVADFERRIIPERLDIKIPKKSE